MLSYKYFKQNIRSVRKRNDILNKDRGSIYVITNTVNGMKYIGQTKTTINQRFASHKFDSKRRGTPLYCAMRKYSLENFIISSLEDNIPYEELDEKEIYYIELYNTVHPNGYNIEHGGRAYKTKETLALMSERVSGEKNPMYGMCGELNYFYGKKHSDETKAKSSASLKKAWANISEEEKALRLKRLKDMRDEITLVCGSGMKGKHHSEESKAKMREKLKNRVFTEEHRKKIKENNTKRRAVIMIDKNNDEEIMSFDSMTEACSWLISNCGLNKAAPGEISCVCSGKRITAYGYKWKYL